MTNKPGGIPNPNSGSGSTVKTPPQILVTPEHPYGVDSTKVTYGFDVYHGDSDDGPFQFGQAVKPQLPYPPRQFCFAKCTQGINYTDPHYADHKFRTDLVNSKSENLGLRKLLFGAYHFLTIDSSPEKQAAYFLEKAKLSIGNLVPMLDVEFDPDSDSKPNKEIALACAKEIKRLCGFWPIIYCGEWDYRNLYESVFPFDAHTLCIAKYSATPGKAPYVSRPTVPCEFHQYTENGRIDINNNMNYDLDVFFGSYEELVTKHVIRKLGS